MKIYTTNTNSIQLVINFWLLRLLGILILLGGLFTFAYTQIQYSIVCKEKQPHLAAQCSLESNLYSVYHSHTDLGVLTHAVVMSRSNGKGGLTYWINLLTENGLIALTGGTSSGRANKDAAALAINNYINNSSDTQFAIPYATPWWVYLIAGIASIIGISLILALKSTVIDFNRVLKSVIIKRKGLTRPEETKLAFSEIDKIIIEEFRSRNGVTYRLAFLLKNQSSLPLARTYDSNRAEKERIAAQLNAFIGAG